MLDSSDRKPWVRRAILLGVAYLVIRLVFGALDNSSGSNPVRIWRIAAWVVSALVYAAQIGYEHFRLANSPRSTALHVAVAVGVGGFGLAAAAIVHSLLVASSNLHLLFVALLVWPIITALSAFLVALAASKVLARLPRSG